MKTCTATVVQRKEETLSRIQRSKKIINITFFFLFFPLICPTTLIRLAAQ